MQNEHIFFAPSLTEVIKQLTIYRPSGMLTIWRVGSTRQDGVRITIEHGRLLHVFWGSQKENANDSILGWLDSWGAIHFSFFSTEIHLQLPAPSQTTTSEQSSPSQFPMRSSLPNRRSSVTQPMYSLSTMTHPPNKPVARAENQQGKPASGSGKEVQERTQTQEIRSREERGNNVSTANNEAMTAIAYEMVIVSLTANGKSYSITNLPRYERTIFMLINGRRTVADLAQLTKRSLEEIYNTLYRLRDMQLITIELQEKKVR